MLYFGNITATAGGAGDLWTNTGANAPVLELNTAVTGADNGILLEQLSPGLLQALLSIQNFLITQTVGDGATMDYVEFEHFKNYVTWTLYQAAAQVQQFSLNNIGFMVQDAANLEQFVIEPNGKIRVSQAQAPGVHAVLAKEIPVYAANTGVLIGYIPVYT